MCPREFLVALLATMPDLANVGVQISFGSPCLLALSVLEGDELAADCSTLSARPERYFCVEGVESTDGDPLAFVRDLGGLTKLGQALGLFFVGRACLSEQIDVSFHVATSAFIGSGCGRAGSC